MSGGVTLNSRAAVRGTLTLPRWGVWWAELWTTPGESPLTGEATIVLGLQSFRGTIVSGGESKGDGTGHYLIVGGANGWGKSIDPFSDRSGLGVKLSAVVTRAANAAGEKLAPVLEKRIGPAFVHERGPAVNVLDAVAPEDWYVDEAGVTHLGARAPSTYALPFTKLERNEARRRMLLVADDVRGLVPGAALDGWTIGTVRHELTAEGLRSHVWAQDLSLGDRLWNSVARIARWVMRPTFFHGVYAYRVTRCLGGYCDVTPESEALGLPAIANVPARVGIPGGIVDVQKNTTVLVGFVNGDVTRPYVTAYESAAGSGFLPVSTGLDASDHIALGGDTATDAAALASKVDVELGKIKTALISVANGGGALTGANTYTAPVSVASSFVRAR